jgi:hypothetical protein
MLYELISDVKDNLGSELLNSRLVKRSFTE